jgi:hypothetical protein
MADSDNQQAFSPGTQPEKETNWVPMAVGAALVIAVLVGFILFSGTGNSGKTSQTDPYLSKIEISNLHMATAENFAGGSVTYIEGSIKNAGDKKVTAARAQVIFKNSLGEIAQKETLPVMVELPNTPYLDYGTVDRAPLASGQSRNFRLTLEHVTADWDGQLPAVKVISASH